MGTIKDIFLGASTLVPARWLYKEKFPETLLPYQHLVSDRVLPHIHRIYPYKGTRQFREDLDYLARNYRVVGPEDLHLSLEQYGQTPAGSFLLTFDDGLREVYDVIAPILREKGIPAIFFINPAFLDNRELFYRMKISVLMDALVNDKTNAIDPRLYDILGIPTITDGREKILTKLKALDQTEIGKIDAMAGVMGVSFAEYSRQWQPYMDLEQVKVLSGQGFTIGGHSWDHPYYRLLNMDEQIDQTMRSCAFVQEHFGPKTLTFAFPHADGPVTQPFFDRMMSRTDRPDLFFGTQNQMLETSNRILHRFNAERPETSMEKMVAGIRLMTRARRLAGRGGVHRGAAASS